MNTAQVHRKVPTGPDLLSPSTQILSSIDQNTLPSAPLISPHRKATNPGLRILPLSHPSCVSGPEAPTCPSNHGRAAETGFSIIPIQPVIDTDFGNQRAFGEWLDKETEMGDETEIEDSTMDGDISSLSVLGLSHSPTDEQLPMSATSPTVQKSRAQGITSRRARNTGFRMLPRGHSERMPEVHNASLTISRFCEYSC